MPHPSQVITTLIGKFEEKVPGISPDDEKIKINTVISKAAFVYEKIRNAVDYGEEHLIRKNAIYRIMKRKLLFEKVILENYLLDKYHQDNIAEHLLQELIRGRYIEDNVSIRMISVVDGVIFKYNALLNKIREIQGKIDKKTFRMILEMEAVEIENLLIPDLKHRALIRTMFSVFNARLQLPNEEMDEKEKEMQLYIACHRLLFKWDDAMINYLLFSLYYPQWKTADEALIAKLANNFDDVKKEFNRQLNHPWGRDLLKILQRHVITFWIIQDLIEQNAKNVMEVFSDPEILEEKIKEACKKRYKGVGAKTRRGVVRSIIYVFFTKMVLALAIEFPFDYFLTGAVNYNTAAVNIGFPPILMLVVAMTIRLPKAENTKKITSEIKQIVYPVETPKKITLRLPDGRGQFAKGVFHIIYAVTFILSLMVIFYTLNKFEFNVFSSLIFVLFLTLVSFFGIRIRRPIKDIMAIERRDNLISSLVDFVALPFVSMGRWMSTKFSKINFLAFFLDFIIEAPFKLLIEIFEDLFKFYKEKKEDIMIE